MEEIVSCVAVNLPYIQPHWDWLLERCIQLSDGLKVYQSLQLRPPIEWLTELEQHRATFAHIQTLPPAWNPRTVAG